MDFIYLIPLLLGGVVVSGARGDDTVKSHSALQLPQANVDKWGLRGLENGRLLGIGKNGIQYISSPPLYGHRFPVAPKKKRQNKLLGWHHAGWRGGSRSKILQSLAGRIERGGERQRRRSKLDLERRDGENSEWREHSQSSLGGPKRSREQITVRFPLHCLQSQFHCYARNSTILTAMG